MAALMPKDCHIWTACPILFLSSFQVPFIKIQFLFGASFCFVFRQKPFTHGHRKSKSHLNKRLWQRHQKWTTVCNRQQHDHGKTTEWKALGDRPGVTSASAKLCKQETIQRNQRAYPESPACNSDFGFLLIMGINLDRWWRASSSCRTAYDIFIAISFKQSMPLYFFWRCVDLYCILLQGTTGRRWS